MLKLLFTKFNFFFPHKFRLVISLHLFKKFRKQSKEKKINYIISQLSEQFQVQKNHFVFHTHINKKKETNYNKNNFNT